MINFDRLSGGDLYHLGKMLGEIAGNRPDIVHHFVLGFRDWIDDLNDGKRFPCTANLGDTIWDLWRHGHYGCTDLENLKGFVPFLSLKRTPSGVGSL